MHRVQERHFPQLDVMQTSGVSEYVSGVEETGNRSDRAVPFASSSASASGENHLCGWRKVSAPKQACLPQAVTAFMSHKDVVGVLQHLHGVRSHAALHAGFHVQWAHTGSGLHLCIHHDLEVVG
mmetsp:Transcript_11135/g.15273  ORF Transcript_11135/g.15273 Transcript_11135/m.15273 type:complete len:124 (-) Transcript_11135:765-1136(-)